MEISFNCPNCGRSLVADTADVGHLVRCPVCLQTIPLGEAKSARAERVDKVKAVTNESSAAIDFPSRQIIDVIDGSSIVQSTSEGLVSEDSEIVNVYSTKKNADTLPSRETKHGVGGWLLLFVLAVGVFRPLYLFSVMSSEYLALSPYLGRDLPVLTAALYAYISVGLVVAIYGWISVYKLSVRSVDAVVFAKRMIWVVAIVVTSASWTWVIYASGEFEISVELPQLVGLTVGNLIFAIVWSAYFNGSKRVRNTYEHT